MPAKNEVFFIFGGQSFSQKRLHFWQAYLFIFGRPYFVRALEVNLKNKFRVKQYYFIDFEKTLHLQTFSTNEAVYGGFSSPNSFYI